MRNAGGRAALHDLGRGGEAYAAAERIGGSLGFVEQVRGDGEAAAPARGGRWTWEAVRQRVCAAIGVAPDAVAGGGRVPAVSGAREGIASL